MDILDYIIEGNTEVLTKVSSTIGMEKIAKTRIPTLEEQDSLPDEEVALIIRSNQGDYIKKFACSTPELTLLNLHALVSIAENLPQEYVKIAAINLTAAAAQYNLEIPEELRPYKSTSFVSPLVESIDKTAFYQKNLKNKPVLKVSYALPSEKKYPINTQEMIKIASTYFDNYKTKFSIEDRFLYAKNVQEQANKLETPSSLSIEKYANLDLKKFAHNFIKQMQARASYTDNTKYLKILEHAYDIGPVKTAILVESLDKETGANKAYDKYLDDPIVAVFKLKKEASIEIDEKVIDKSRLNQMTNFAQKNKLLDNSVIKEMRSKDGLAIFESLPKPVREQLYASGIC